MAPDPRIFHTIGVLKRADDPNLAYWLWLYKCALKRILVWHWRDMQQYSDPETSLKWVHAMQLMELDRKAQRDLILLAYSGHKGRTLANKLMFQLLSYKALSDPDYENLSNWVSAEIKTLRRSMDRPPWFHRDMFNTWTWESLESISRRDLPFSPHEVPADAAAMCRTGTHGEPLPPPDCWQVEQCTWV